MAYTKTTWVEGSAPGITAARLNNMENGIAEADTRMGGVKVYGNAAYTDSISAGATLTKSIPLGGSIYKNGIAVIGGSSGDGIMVFFGTDNTKTLATGLVGTDSGGAWSRRAYGSITGTGSSSPGWAVSGYGTIKINDVYIDGSNLKIVFQNTDGSARSLNCNVDWEVW